MKIAAFPKCYLEELSSEGGMTVFEWIEMAGSLGAEGLEMYEGFFTSLEDGYIIRVRDAIAAAGFAMPMLCCSPNFTHPDRDERAKAIDNQARMMRICKMLGGDGAVCRVLSGQRYPDVSREQGLAWVVECIEQVLPVAREHNIILGLENHYKDGFWAYPEFAQKMDVFLELLDAIPERRHFGVQYDPSNAIVAGDDPIALLRAVADRVVSVHASDRYLQEGYALDGLLSSDGTIGYPQALQHGVTGQGLNDYDRIFEILRAVGFSGWVSIEDGMNGMEEMRASIDFLKLMRDKYFMPES